MATLTDWIQDKYKFRTIPEWVKDELSFNTPVETTYTVLSAEYIRGNDWNLCTVVGCSIDGYGYLVKPFMGQGEIIEIANMDVYNFTENEEIDYE